MLELFISLGLVILNVLAAIIGYTELLYNDERPVIFLIDSMIGWVGLSILLICLIAIQNYRSNNPGDRAKSPPSILLILMAFFVVLFFLPSPSSEAVPAQKEQLATTTTTTRISVTCSSNQEISAPFESKEPLKCHTYGGQHNATAQYCVPSERFSDPTPQLVIGHRTDQVLGDQELRLVTRDNQSCWIYQMNTGEDSAEKGISGGEIHYCMPLGCQASENDCHLSPPVIMFLWDNEPSSS
ncbi:hypothetical protein GLAREA_02947 [Glarea lozoyensis ATCC 20868]|uniref:Uncharacterized protein n=1 Tax=Glarea lozoyensis (strain ATCC 20868 / MF5171) TaxID=1116229 RepID=S3DKF0_GLAL2|nr:uncharacterized protein GLAREA_02947 [Glarea lozoyensis ATCC 20868]EPE27033.1 hypothetical protein GLAREA_02947 [Glarea lozoyensis ATCC 20868]